jgi:hypothetical protein
MNNPLPLYPKQKVMDKKIKFKKNEAETLKFICGVTLLFINKNKEPINLQIIKFIMTLSESLQKGQTEFKTNNDVRIFLKFMINNWYNDIYPILKDSEDFDNNDKNNMIMYNNLVPVLLKKLK